MRVGFITADLNHKHGWAHYSYDLIKALQASGVDVRIVASANNAQLNAANILPNLVPRERFLLPKLLLKTQQAAHYLTPCDIIHCTVEPFAPLGARIAARQRPFFQSGVGSYLRINHWQRFPLTRLYRRAIKQSHLVCISQYTEQIAKAEFPGIQSSVVTLGVDPSRFDNLPNPSKKGQTVLTVGGIKARKGTLELVKAIAIVRETLPDIQCVIVGNKNEASAYTAQVQEVINRHDLHQNVHLTGFIPEQELMAYYASADLFVLPSINAGWMFEGYGLVHMEASAAGLPVIGTWGCGVEDAVDDGVTGVLVSQTDIETELPQAILELLSDPQKRAHMGAAGRAKAQRQTWQKIAQQMIELYDAALRES